MSYAPPKATATVYIVDDDASVRETLTRMLREAGYETAGYASTGEFLLTRPAERIGCVLLDVRLPGADGFRLYEALVARGVNLPVIFLSGHADFSLCVRAIKAGAVDFLPKPIRREPLLEAVKAALACRTAIEEKRSRARQLRLLLEDLTPREHEVLRLVLAGLLNKQIATELGTALRTVKAHRANVMTKMRVDSVAQLVDVAHELRDAGQLPARTAPVRRLRKPYPGEPLQSSGHAAGGLLAAGRK